MGDDLPLVGRAEETTFVVDAVRRRRGILIAGAPGVGKTRLAHEVVATLGGEFAVVWAAATPPSASIPFGAVAHLIEDPDGIGTSPIGLSTLTGVAASILARAGGGAVLVVIDDAQWLDEGSAALVNHLIRSSPTRILVTARTGEPLPEPVHGLWKDLAIERVELQPLTLVDVADLLAGTGPLTVQSSSIRRFWNLSRGNPLFLRELLIDARAAGAFDDDRRLHQWFTSFAPSVRLAEILENRLAQIGPAGRAALDLVALGEPIALDMVLTLCDGRAISEAERAGLIVVENGDEPTVHLCHPLYGEQLRAAMSVVERRRIFAALLAATQVESPRSHRDVLRFAVWAMESGANVDSELLTEAARLAFSLSDASLAERLARRAVQVGGGVEPTRLLATTLTVQGRPEAAIAAIEVVDINSMTPREGMDLAIARYQAVTALHGARPEHEEQLLEAEQRLDDPQDRAYIQAQRATLLAFTGQLDLAEALCETLRSDADDLAEMRSVTPLGVVLVCRGRCDTAEATASRLLERSFELRDRLPAAPFWATSLQLTAMWGAGRYAEADALLDFVESAIDLAVAPEDVTLYLRLGRGLVCLARGKARAAHRLLTQVIEPTKEFAVFRVPFVASHLAEACALVGDRAGALAASATADAYLAGGRVYEGMTRRAQAWAAFADGRRSMATDLALEAAEWSGGHGHHAAEMLGYLDALRLGDDAAVAGPLTEVAGRVEGPLAAAVALHASAFRDDNGARIDAAASTYAETGATLLAAEASVHAAESFDRAGLQARRDRSMARARALATRCEGARSPVLERLDQPGVINLTRREAEIVHLAAEGLSSKAIAERLIVSVRTVDGHLYRAYSKLGVTDRGSLRAVVGEDPAKNA